jgi:riboflavin kinase, archaea type
LPSLVFEGKVYSGRGEGKRFLELPWVRRQIQQKLGFTPYTGTLNLRLLNQDIEKRKQLQTEKAIVVEPEAGYCPGSLFKANITKVKCAVIFPLVPKYPTDVLEIIAPLYLRGKLNLADGTLVAVTVTF